MTKNTDHLIARIVRRAFGLVAGLSLSLALSASPTLAQTPTTPVLVTSSSVTGATLGIPRWKGYQSPSSPDKFWASFANGGGSSSNLSFTTDAGATWSNHTINIDGYLDFHLSLFGHNNDLFFTFPGASGTRFRRFADPSETINDADGLVTFGGTTASYRSNVMVQDNGRVWVFTRLGGNSGQNVLFRRSDNGGSSWTTGTAFSTGAPDVRIGSMPYVNGNPALVVLHLNDARGYEYYLWNGSSFEARPDHSIYAAYVGYDRSFTHNQTNDSVFHLVFGDGSNLRHVWKNYNGGNGSWTTSVVMSDANNGSIDWFPIMTAHGEDVYLFYVRKPTGSDASKRIFYRKWTGSSHSWGSEYQVSTQSYSGDPNTTFHVPPGSDYIPVFYSAGSGSSTIYFSKIPISPSNPDLISPGRVDDLGVIPGGAGGEVELGWTATGDDDATGTADSYDLRYQPSMINEGNWSSATPLVGPSPPQPSGQAESITISDLPTGGILYFGLKAIDEAGNQSDLSNISFLLVSDVDDTGGDPLLPDRTSLVSLTPNPFNSEARIEYQVATTTPIKLTVRNILGQHVTRLVDDSMPVGRHTVFWNGTDDRGHSVATGVYFVNLISDHNTESRKLVHLK